MLVPAAAEQAGSGGACPTSSGKLPAIAQETCAKAPASVGIVECTDLKGLPMTEQFGTPGDPERAANPATPANTPSNDDGESPRSAQPQPAGQEPAEPATGEQSPTVQQPSEPVTGQQEPVSQKNGERNGRQVGIPVFIAGVLVAGLIGGGVAATAGALLADSAQTGSITAGNESIVVNNKDSVNAITAASVAASPSVVTLAVSGDGASGSGSGIILDTEGHILTNTHVVTLGGQVGNATVEVRTNDGRVFQAEVVGTDPLSDLAVVKVDAPDLTPATLGNSDELNVGDIAIAIGSPLGLSGTVTDGIVSTLNRTISVASSAVPEQQTDAPQGEDGGGFNFLPPDGTPSPQKRSQGSIYLNVIQTDAAINQGNSGGALVDAKGRVIGVNVAIASSGSGGSAGNIGVGFSIPITYAQRVANEIIDNGKATHGFLGVSVRPAPAEGGSKDTSFSVGALVEGVEPGSPAADAGLRKGDVITKFGEQNIIDPQALTATVRMQPEGGATKVEVLRDGKPVTVDVTLTAAPA